MQFRKWLESTDKMFLEGRRKLAIPDFHPEHVTKFNIINPKFLTSSVVALAKEAAGESYKIKQERIKWIKAHTPKISYEGAYYDNTGRLVTPWVIDGEGTEPQQEVDPDTYKRPPSPFPPPKEPNPSVLPILADALEEAGLQDQPFLQLLRRGQVNDSILDLIAHRDPNEVEKIWNGFSGHQRAELEKEAAKEAIKNLHIRLLGKNTTLPVGYTIIRNGGSQTGGMRGNPPPGEIWVKSASRSRRWYHPAQRKEGRPLLPKEYRDLIDKKKEKKD